MDDADLEFDKNIDLPVYVCWFSRDFVLSSRGWDDLIPILSDIGIKPEWLVVDYDGELRGHQFPLAFAALKRILYAH